MTPKNALSAHVHLSPLLGIPLAVAAGLAIPLQGRVNGALGAVLDDGIAAAVVSFSVGLVIMIATSLLLPRGRAGMAAMIPAVRARKFPPWYLLAGVIGAFFVMSQGLTISLLGVALFTVSTVTGQMASGLLVDRLGMGPAGKKRINGMRVLGALLTIAAVVWAVSPRFGGGSGSGYLLLPLLLPLAAGFLQSFQQAMNGTQTLHYGTPIAATLVNLATGTVVLWAAWLVKAAVAGAGNPLPGEWWYYLGGPLGCIYIGVGAVLVRSLGILLTGLGMIAGQLLGSLALDIVLPSAGSHVEPATVLGTLLTLAAIVVATLPWPRVVRNSIGR
ncbi:DMT family transporter [Arthrobacter sp. ERGS1:01]|uniref:DMT family transporter n=1 Tax=Arthrobacter sp. ERGS1:01 TaxID=1704044 RepID=UPI000B296088|nr:DMT family transporter [Arthrobacter sp. ERGS1:01]